MIRPRKRKLYTPISPISDEENVEAKEPNRNGHAEKIKPEVPEKLNSSPAKIEKPASTFADAIAANKNQIPKVSAKEMAENLEWKDLQARFTSHPVTIPSCPLQRFNSLDIANAIATKNFKDKLMNEDEDINLLDVVRKKIMLDTEEHHKPKPAVLINIHCDSLKSMFLDHEASTSSVVMATAAIENPITRQRGFISSHMIEKLSDSSSEVIDETKATKENKQLITMDVFEEWIKEFCSAAASTSKPADCGIFPSTLSLATSSRKLAQKNRQLDSIIPP